MRCTTNLKMNSIPYHRILSEQVPSLVVCSSCVMYWKPASWHGNDVTMLEDNSSVNAHAPLKVVNTRGFDLPATGDRGVWMYGVIGILLMAGSLTLLIINAKKKR